MERFHRTLKKWLARQPAARSLRQLQAQLDTFQRYYNEQRPHRALGRSTSATPAAAYSARPKATPSGVEPSHERVHRERIDDTGAVSVRYHGRLHHIDDIWRIQRQLDFPGTVYGVPRDTPASELMRRQSDWYGAHRDDEIIG